MEGWVLDSGYTHTNAKWILGSGHSVKGSNFKAQGWRATSHTWVWVHRCATWAGPGQGHSRTGPIPRPEPTTMRVELWSCSLHRYRLSSDSTKYTQKRGVDSPVLFLLSVFFLAFNLHNDKRSMLSCSVCTSKWRWATSLKGFAMAHEWVMTRVSKSHRQLSSRSTESRDVFGLKSKTEFQIETW